jgi:23S rRNA (adenine2030-N6)-methyltransferase
MLSYRHGFHAGNFADALKHLVLVQLLRYMNQKDKPYWVIDAHGGAGVYALDEGFAAKNGEYESGIAKLWQRDDLPPALADYVALVKELNPSGKLRRYPGSPWLALRLMREADRLRLFELHSTESRVLAQTLDKAFPGQEKRYAIRQADGFTELKSVLPPPPRRGLTLIDPAYEDKRDYLRTLMAVKEGLARFPTGTFAVWYPQLPRGDARQLPDKLWKLPCASRLDVSLAVRAPAKEGYGMHGSGLSIANPPWTLAETLRETLPFLSGVLAQDGEAGHTLRYEEGEERKPTAAAPSRARESKPRSPR